MGPHLELVTSVLGGTAHRFHAHPLVYITMPFVAALIGWLTKLAFIRMMFWPLDYHGIGPIGWQGILPRRAEKMARTAMDLLMRDLVNVDEIMARLDASEMAEQMREPMNAAVDRLARAILAEFQPSFWETLPDVGRRLIVGRLQAQSPRIVEEILDDIKANIDEVFDLEDMAITSLTSDRQLLNDLFAKIGHKEFKFIIRSGIYFGFLLGVVQAATYAIINQPLVLPGFGLFVGSFTDWLALKMLFHPKEPKRVLGFELQGLFLKRQKEVARDYAELVCEQILTPENFFEALLTGPKSDRLYALVHEHVKRIIDSQVGLARPVVVLAVGPRQWQQLKERAGERMRDELPIAFKFAEPYAAGALDVRDVVVEKMEAMTPLQFESLLRPAFREEEWLIVIVGAALGFVIGFAQDLLIVPLFAHLL